MLRPGWSSSMRPWVSERRPSWHSGAPARLDGRRFAWISLDGSDNDPGTLWSYVVRALERAAPEFDGGNTLRALRVRQPDYTGAVLPVLINELTRLSGPVILVLDDYDVISDGSCHQQLAFLLLNLPSSVQIVVITRTTPPLPLARLRAAGQMAEFGQRQLRFRAAEAAALLQAVSGAELAEPDLAVLMERTEGWPPPSIWPRSRSAEAPRRTPLSASSPAITGSSSTCWRTRS